MKLVSPRESIEREREAVHTFAMKIEESLQVISDRAASRVCEQVPSYRNNADSTLREDVAAHCHYVFKTFVRSLMEQRPSRRAEFEVAATYSMRRVTQNIPLADFLQAFRISQMTLWEMILELTADHPELSAAATASVQYVMQVIEAGSTAAAESYIEAQQYLLADADRAARDLVEDLLAGRPPAMGIRQDSLRDAGFVQSSKIVVGVGGTVDDTGDKRVIARALGQAAQAGAQGVVTIRGTEIVGIFPVSDQGSSSLLARLRPVLQAMNQNGLQVSFGTSTVHESLDDVPKAYREAAMARSSRYAVPGVHSLESLSAFEYLVTRADETARRLITPRIHRFVEEDDDADGLYIVTLVAYVESNLNAKATAAKIYVHSNTAYARLDRIAERTGKDMRNFADVLDLLVAVRLLAPRRASFQFPAGAGGRFTTSG
ncbi:hypothetical protein CH275_09970 [Rhodococcus sp. 06-235-1A]|nr:hypothetical protein CH275_09970 [Rhodococcus sp. 06-235-1A]